MILRALARAAGRWMLFGVSMDGAPSVAAELLVGQPPSMIEAEPTARVAAASIASGEEATDAGGTAAPLEEEFPVEPAEPAVVYPDALQQD